MRPTTNRRWWRWCACRRTSGLVESAWRVSASRDRPPRLEEPGAKCPIRRCSWAGDQAEARPGAGEGEEQRDDVARALAVVVAGRVVVGGSSTDVDGQGLPQSASICESGLIALLDLGDRFGSSPSQPS